MFKIITKLKKIFTFQTKTHNGMGMTSSMLFFDKINERDKNGNKTIIVDPKGEFYSNNKRK